MRLTRRTLLAGLGATTLLPRMAQAGTGGVTLTAREGRVQVAPSAYPETTVWGFDGQVPGPLLRATQNDRLRCRLVNDLSQPTAIHWHGLRVENAMDGVPGMTQDPVPTGGHFDYDCRLPDAGTFWYHSHNQSAEQVARGLFGPLVIDEPDAPDVDHDLMVVVNDWRMTEDAQIHESFGQMHDLSHGGRIGNYVHIDVTPRPETLNRNQRLRLRFLNPSTDRILQLGVIGLTGWVMALDGMPLETPAPLADFILAPAQRLDAFVDVTAGDGETAMIVQHERDGTFVLDEFPVTGAGTSRPRPAPPALPPNPVIRAVAGPDTRHLRMEMEGGAMGGLREGTYKGRKMSMRDLVSNGQVWTLGGVAGLPDDPWAQLERGETLRVTLVNNTAFPHAMHLHGHHFHELRPDGPGPLRDTLLVMPSEERDIAFVADNPGNWLFHCHMLSHQTAGMKTWIKVA
ncbi:multicopper oxidase family protein [Shimia biformata]|uniref:multicopper oxidase family protein n=1 Tax=Shimia biformata TaxID=1294299 RepID=UPI001950AC72|nr:multicopper oxidase family protein [Shimia biformata]